MVRRLGLGKNNHLSYASLALNPRAVWSYSWMDQKPCLNKKTHVLIMKFTWIWILNFWYHICYVEPSILEFYDDVRGSLRNWCHCKQHSEPTAMLVCHHIWKVYTEFTWSFGAFSSQFGIVIVSYARGTIIDGYFIAITFARSLGRYSKTQPSGLVFKELPRDRANVSARKTMGDPYRIPSYCK